MDKNVLFAEKRCINWPKFCQNSVLHAKHHCVCVCVWVSERVGVISLLLWHNFLLAAGGGKKSTASYEISFQANNPSSIYISPKLHTSPRAAFSLLSEYFSHCRAHLQATEILYFSFPLIDILMRWPWPEMTSNRFPLAGPAGPAVLCAAFL